MQKLLIQGKNAFDEIIREIDSANNSIEIKMFIWRDDIIGNLIAKHLLIALKRGVKVSIYKDTYGSIFEKSEENKMSFFNKKTSISLYIKSFFLASFVYFNGFNNFFLKQNNNNLLEELLKFKNFKLNTKLYKDHTKYFIFDNEKMILGGINIEDKEVLKDNKGRKYQDYMIKLSDPEAVDLFKNKNKSLDFNSKNTLDFIINNEIDKSAIKILLKLIKESNKKIIMTMAYFGNKKITKELIKKRKSGVEVVIYTSNVSNVQNEYNRKVLKKLYKNGISIYLHNGLVHAKAILFDDALVLGSINLNNASLKKLGELSIYTKDNRVIKDYLEDIKRIKKESFKANLKSFRYRFIKAFFEKLYS